MARPIPNQGDHTLERIVEATRLNESNFERSLFGAAVLIEGVSIASGATKEIPHSLGRLPTAVLISLATDNAAELKESRPARSRSSITLENVGGSTVTFDLVLL